MTTNRIPAADVMSQAFSTLWREKSLLLLLAGFLSILSMIWFYPFLEIYAAFLSSTLAGEIINQDQFGDDFLDFMPYFLIGLIPMLFIQYGAIVLWSRAAILGTSQAFEGGIKVLLNRTLWALWRYICGMGWMLLIVLGLSILALIISIILGVGMMGTGDSNSLFGFIFILLIIPVYIVMFMGLFMLTVLISIGVHSEARDLHLPIHRAYKLMKGNLLRAAGLLLLIIFFFNLAMSPLLLFAFPMGSSGPSVSSVGLLLGFFLVFVLAIIYNMLWFSYGAIYAQKLVPELRE